jgi:hypothetical protein
MTSTPSISLNCVITLNTLSSLQADRASKEALCPASIPLSPNYFDVISEEEDAPPEGTLERERELPELHRALALYKSVRSLCKMQKGSVRQLSLEIELITIAKESHYISKLGSNL